MAHHITKRIYALHDTLNDNEVVCRGDAVELAAFAGTSRENINGAFRSGGRVKRRWTVEQIGEAPVIQPVHHYSPPVRKSKPIELESLRQLRNSIPIGTMVRVFAYVEDADLEQELGIYPIVEKYRHVFTVQMEHFTESFSWVNLYRKDGVELL